MRAILILILMILTLAGSAVGQTWELAIPIGEPVALTPGVAIEAVAIQALDVPASAVENPSIWDSIRLRAGYLTSIQHDMDALAYIVPFKLASKQAGEATLSWTIDAVGLAEDISVPLRINKGTIGSSLMIEHVIGSASAGLTWIKDYELSFYFTPISKRF